MSVIADDIQWSPQYIMEEKLLDMKIFVEALKGYFETFDNVQFLEGEGLI